VSKLASSHETILQAGLEEIEPGRWLVNVFDMPGCYSSAASMEAALAAAPDQARWYYRWLSSKDGGFPEIDGDLRVQTIEQIPLRGFFEKDAQAIRPWDLDLALRVLAWNREDLLGYLRTLEGRLEPPAADVIPKTLIEHIYRSELWLLSRLHLSTEDLELPSGVLDRMEVVRQQVLALLPDWVNSNLVVSTENEKWSPRKVLRRLLWHDRDHIPHA
jgi:hypothetical protein